jgi:hypothetical protein
VQKYISKYVSGINLLLFINQPVSVGKVVVINILYCKCNIPTVHDYYCKLFFNSTADVTFGNNKKIQKFDFL